MQYTVVHSKDPYLLARLATDVELITGLKTADSNVFNPFYGSEYIAFDEGETSYFLNHEGVFNPIRHELTSRNYIKVLTQILKP